MQPSQVAHSSKMQQSPKVLVNHSPTMRRQVRSKLRCVDMCMWTKRHFFLQRTRLLGWMSNFYECTRKSEEGIAIKYRPASRKKWKEWIHARLLCLQVWDVLTVLVCMSDNFLVQLDAQHISTFIFASGPARLGELASSAFMFSFLPRQPGNVGRW